MQKIFLKSTTNDLTIERELRRSETIMDIRKYLSQQLNTDVVNIKIAFNGKIVTDAISLGHLEKDGNLTLNFIVKKTTPLNDEVEMNTMDKNVCIKILSTGEKRYVDPSRIITRNGQLLLVKRRDARRNIAEELREVVFGLRMDIIVKIAMIIALFATNNKEFAFMLTLMLFLRGLSNIKFRVKMKNIRGNELILKSIVAFFVSMFMLNADQILDFRSD